MKKIAMATATLLALSAPALAQNAMTPGSAGVTGGATGSNPGTGPATTNGDTGSTTYSGRATAPDDARSGAMAPAPRDPANQQ